MAWYIFSTSLPHYKELTCGRMCHALDTNQPFLSRTCRVLCIALPAMNLLVTPTAALATTGKTKSLAVWRSCMAAAARTTVACAVVASVRYYTPDSFGHYITFPALSYVIAVIIATDATLGDALHGATCTLSGTVHGIAPAILVLWAVGPRHFNVAIAALAVGLSSFFVALPGSTHVTTKRVALAQIVLVYVAIDGPSMEPVMHPLRVGASAILGALAAVIALLVPYPRLAHCEVKEKSRLFVEIVSDKLRLFATAFCTDDSNCAAALVSQAKSMEKPCNKLLQIVKSKQEGMKWESLPIGCTTSHLISLSQRLQALETPLRGMETALSTMPSFPVQLANEELKALLPSYINHKCLTLKQMTITCKINSSTVHETDMYCMPIKSPHTNIASHLLTHENLPSFFFLFCMNLLNATPTPSPEKPLVSSIEEATACSHKQRLFTYFRGCVEVCMKRFMVAFKCSLILGLSVFLGMLFSRENGYWAGLTVALGMVSVREATYKVANLKAQGTLLGSVYGVLGCFIPEGLIGVRLLVLIPWFIFTTFLKCSRMYGPIGASSAAIAAILIMGRKSYGLANAFAIMRITEIFIALSCSILVELLLQTVRASTLAKASLSESLILLEESVEVINGGSEWKGNLKKLQGKVNEMGKLIDEAEMEPNFWFQPFPGPCYRKILGTMVKMVDLLHFGFLSLELLWQQWQDKEALEGVCGDLNMLKKLICSSIKHLEEIARVKSLPKLEMEFEKANGSGDLESPKAADTTSNFHKGLCTDQEDTEKIVSSLLQHGKTLMDTAGTVHGGEEVKTHIALPLGTLSFCVEKLFKETREMEKDMRELLQSENPSRHINLYDISCKIKHLSM